MERTILKAFQLKNLFTFLIFIFTLMDGYSQNSTALRANIVSIEVGGPGGYGALNYERIITIDEQFSLGGKIGFSTVQVIDFTQKFNPDLLIPLSISVYYGKTHKVHLGFGQTISNTVYADQFNGKPSRRTSFHTHFNIGYRYQKQENRFIYGISYSPIIEFQKIFKHWGSIMIGYTF
ncbi:hypothetical protein [Brumimicrobium aurantiacum]|nr:hypothetical protein [Brumimicrobium aurantiacum]